MSSQEGGSGDDTKTLKYIGGAIAVVGAAGLLYYFLKGGSDGGEQKKRGSTTPRKKVAVDSKLKYKRRINDRFNKLSVCPDVDGNDCYFTSDPINEEQKN